MGTALIVDDNPDIRSLLNQALLMEGIEVQLAGNGAEAIEQIEAGVEPCIVFLDLMMPVMDGHQFLDWKNNHSTLADVPVVIISALNASKKLTGICRYLKKPIDIDDLYECVEKYCG